MSKGKWVAVVLCGSIWIASAVEASERIIIAEPKDQPRITVSATAEVITKPDLATVELVVTSTESRLQRAFEKNTEATNQIMSALKQRGVKPEDIQTRGYHINPIYDNKRKPVRYTVTHQIAAKIRTFETLGPLLDDAVDEEVTTVQQIVFSVEDHYRMEQSARVKAAQLARQKAEDLAVNAGARLGRALKLTDSTSWPQPIQMRGQQLTFIERSMAQAKEAYMAPPELAPGMLKFSVTCSAEYALEP